jgi:uncharacterized membrane protein YphA (DoxX/SURF4 family)
VLWTLTVFSAGMFLFAGTLKLAGVPAMVETFARVGIGQWLRYLTGTIEVAGAFLLVVPSLALFAAVPLAATMFFAVLAHLFVLGGSPAPAILLLVATTAVGWLRWSER